MKAQDDPMAFMAFIASAHSVRLMRPIPHGWTAVVSDLHDMLSQHLSGEFAVMLGGENLLTDDEAEFVIYIEKQEDIDICLVALPEIHSRKTGRETKRERIPDWLSSDKALDILNEMIKAG